VQGQWAWGKTNGLGELSFVGLGMLSGIPRNKLWDSCMLAHHQFSFRSRLKKSFLKPRFFRSRKPPSLRSRKPHVVDAHVQVQAQAGTRLFSLLSLFLSLRCSVAPATALRLGGYPFVGNSEMAQATTTCLGAARPRRIVAPGVPLGRTPPASPPGFSRVVESLHLVD
jgi:hypothetical protein